MLYTHIRLLLYTHIGHATERCCTLVCYPLGVAKPRQRRTHQKGSEWLNYQGVAQPAARLVRDEEVAGANPATLTTKGPGVTAARRSPKPSGVRATRAAPASRTLPTRLCSTFPIAPRRAVTGRGSCARVTCACLITASSSVTPFLPRPFTPTDDRIAQQRERRRAVAQRARSA